MDISKLNFLTSAARPIDKITRAKPTETVDPVAKQAERWVAQTFFGTLLKQIRDSPFKSELFSGGRGAEAFGPLFDASMIDRIASGVGGKLSKAIVNQIHATKAYEKSKPTAIPSSTGPRA